MNKTFFLLATFVFLFGVLLSCNKDESSFEPPKSVNSSISRESNPNQALDSLLNAIDEYNAAFNGESRVATLRSMEFEHGTDIQRGLWGFLKKICKLIVADAAGAVSGAAAGTQLFGSEGALPGAIAGGVASSVAAAVDQFDLDGSNPKRLVLPESCPFLTSIETGSTMGEAHNKVTYEVIKSNPNFARMKISELHNAVITEFQKLYGRTDALPSLSVVSNILKSVQVHLLQNEMIDDENWYTSFQQITQCQPKVNKLIVDFALNVNRIRSENRDVRSYTKGYYKIVEASNVSVTDKQLILDGTSVAANSCIFWNDASLK